MPDPPVETAVAISATLQIRRPPSSSPSHPPPPPHEVGSCSWICLRRPDMPLAVIVVEGAVGSATCHRCRHRHCWIRPPPPSVVAGDRSTWGGAAAARSRSPPSLPVPDPREPTPPSAIKPAAATHPAPHRSRSLGCSCRRGDKERERERGLRGEEEKISIDV